MKRRKLKRRYFWKFEDGSILYLRKVRDGQDFESIGGVPRFMGEVMGG